MGILELLYPARCPVCHGILKGKDGICPDCRRRLTYIKEPKCKKCGKQIEKAEAEYCRDCQRFSHAFNQGAAVFVYDDIMRRSVSMFKYHNRREYAKVYAVEMYRHCEYFLRMASPEVILPVPVHKQKRRQRGFNQAELIAKELGKLMKIPVDTKYLIRKEKTTPQKELTRQQRKTNLREAFGVEENGKYYKRVLLIDDIYTTGATMDALSEILRENQTKIIFFLTLCVGRNE